MSALSHIPETIKQFWNDNPTEYSKNDIFHLEPEGENAVFLKYLLENGFATLTLKLNEQPIGNYNGSENTELNINLGTLVIQKNGVTVGSYNGSNSKNINISLGTLTIQKNGTTLQTYNGNNSSTVNVQVPVITYGTATPSGGNSGDVYMRYLA